MLQRQYHIVKPQHRHSSGSAATIRRPARKLQSLNPRLIIDLRCLQDRNTATRGIGQHARSMLANRPDGPAVGLIDPRLDALPEGIAAGLDAIRPDGYFTDLPADTVFLNPSPMTADPMFVARLAGTIRRAAVVHDFIPFEAAPRYLATRERRLRYALALAWLRQYDVFLPVSAATRDRLHDLFGPVPSAVTGVALPEWALPGAGAAPRHILAVAGDDPRKNPEVVIRAHAGSAMQARRIPLIVTGAYAAAAQARFRLLAQQAGGDPALLHLPGHVPDQALRDQVQHAYCVVTASRAEGFSLPVVEAMAAGIASIASDIPAHAALTDPAHRFHPDDVEGLRAMMEGIVLRPERRAAVIAAQARVPEAYAAKAVAARFWPAVLRQKNPGAGSPPAYRRARPRIAVLSPLPPARSGVADYSAACVQALAAHAELFLFSAQRPPPVAGLTVAPLSALAQLANADRVISVLGNSGHHSEIYDLLIRFGGAAICHDSRLLHFYAHKHGEPAAARLAGEELRRTVSLAEIGDWTRDETRREASLLGEAARHARPLIFHARASVELVRRRFNADARFLPFAVPHGWRSTLDAGRKEAAKTLLGFDRGEIHIASFGFLTRDKGAAEALAALRMLRDAGIAARLHFVGEPAGAQAMALAAGLGLDRYVRQTGYVAPERYRQYLLAADLGLQLRNTGPGSISGALQDCIAAGLPTVANTSLAAALEAPGYVARVADGLEPAAIAGALATLIENPPTGLAEQRAAYCDFHSMENYARRLCEILELG